MLPCYSVTWIKTHGPKLTEIMRLPRRLVERASAELRRDGMVDVGGQSDVTDDGGQSGLYDVCDQSDKTNDGNQTG